MESRNRPDRRGLRRRLEAAVLAGALAAGLAGCGGSAPAGAARQAAAGSPDSVSSLEPAWDVVVERNHYVTMGDGTRLAVDVHRPDAPEGMRFPCLLEMTPYRKEARAAEGASWFAPRGYVFAEVDARGTGGSEGQYDIVFSEQEQRDGAAAVEWLATEYPWCNGKVGLFGGSYSGIIQYLIAAQQPPHLKAIAPQRAYSDLYRDIVYHGGIANGSFATIWSSGTEVFNIQGADPTTNPDPLTALQVLADHAQNERMLLNYLNAPYDGPLYRNSSHWTRVGDIRVPAFHLAGLQDTFTRGQLLGFRDALALGRAGVVPGTQYLVLGPWNHSETHFLAYENFARELTEWYRHWLDGGPRPAFMDGPRVRYFVMDQVRDMDSGVWRSADRWPPGLVARKRLYLREGGLLRPEPPAGVEAADTYVYAANANAAEFPSRWDNASSSAAQQMDTDQRLDEARALVYSTPPLDQDLIVTGPMTLHLEAATEPLAVEPGLPLGDLLGVAGLEGLAQFMPPYHDTDWIVKVAEVAPDGRSTLVSAGYLRASHRTLDLAKSTVTPEGVLDPLHPHTAESAMPPASGEVLGYDIEIWPTAKRFRAGYQLRIAIYSADMPEHHPLLKPAVNTVFHTPQQASYLLLSVATP